MQEHPSTAPHPLDGTPAQEEEYANRSGPAATHDDAPLEQRAGTPRGAAAELGRAQDSSATPPPN